MASRVFETPGRDWVQEWMVGLAMLRFDLHASDFPDDTSGWKCRLRYIVCVSCSGYALYMNAFDTYAEARAKIECLIPQLVERAMATSERMLAPIE
jgi:hypothetical protein